VPKLELTHVFRALTDPTRRAVHLGVLEDCGLVLSSKKGRVRTYALAPQPLKAAENWLSAQRLEWERRLDALDDFLETLKEQKR